MAEIDNTPIRLTAQIPLTRGLHAIVDLEDFERANQFKWQAYKATTGVYYAIHSQWASKKMTTTWLHRFLLCVKRGEVVDHIDGNPLNNQKTNIRLCTQAENCRNRGKLKIMTSKYKGVILSIARKGTVRWRATIYMTKDGIKHRMHLGYFDTEIEAAKAYDRAALLHHGSFARLNFAA